MNPQTQPNSQISPNLQPLPAAPEAPKPGQAEAPQPSAVELAPQETTAPAPGAPLPPPQIWPTDAPVVPAPTQAAPVTNPASPGPAIADDVDVIEKEWVDAAQQVIKATSEDPYTEEEAVESLQIDYMKKRYGKEIKKPDQK